MPPPRSITQSNMVENVYGGVDDNRSFLSSGAGLVMNVQELEMPK